MRRNVLFAWTVAVWFPFGGNAQENADLIVNEIQVENIDQFVDPSWNFGGWVELYNPSSKPYRLRGCWVSDDVENLKKVHITQSVTVYGRSYKNLWFDHHDKYCPSQVNMKLNPEGGTFYLSDPDGNLILSQTYPPAVPRASWARMEDIMGDWGYSNSPTPEAPNEIRLALNGERMTLNDRLPAPEPDAVSGLFSKPFQVHVPIPEGAILRYTTNGSTPTLDNGSTSKDGVFTIAASMVLRMAFYGEGKMGSQVITRSYLKKDKNFCLPILSVVTDPDNLYSDELGIFVKGVNGRPGLGQTVKCNWNMDWDRPINFEYMDEKGTSLVNQEAEIRRCGGWGRMQTPYSFKIHSAKQYEGQSTMDYPFFHDKPYNKTKMLLLRNGGNCDYNYRMRDAFLQKLILSSGLDIDAQDYQPVVHYINGIYKGTLNLREPNNKHFIYSNYGLDEDEIDLFVIDNDTGYVQKSGTHESLQRWYDLSKTADKDKTYEEICQMVDIDEYCNYMAIKLFYGDGDWPGNNMKAWRPREKNGKWRYLLYDMDGAFTCGSPFTHFEEMKIHTFNTLLGEPVSNYTMEIEPVTIFLNMLRNEQFRRHFVDAVCILAGSVLEPSRCFPLIDEWAQLVYPMQILPDNGYGRNTSTIDGANDLKNKLNNQAAAMFPVMEDYTPLKISSFDALFLKLSSNLDEARLRLNGQIIPTGHFDGRAYAPVTLMAEAPSGYVFEGWKLISGNVQEGTPVFSHGESWTYYDKGSLDGKSWKRFGYSTSTWKDGIAPLGYGSATGGYATNLTYGGNSNNKFPTYYFRKIFTLKDAPKGKMFHLKYHVDDGFILYINGKEACRYNMPSGGATFQTFSTTYAGTNPLSGMVTISSDLFREGVNVVAVEVHNHTPESSDIYWDAQLSYTTLSETSSQYLSTEAEFTIPSGQMELKACFRKQENDECPKATPVMINEVSAGNSIFVNEYYKKSDWIELYNQTDKAIDLQGMYLSDDVKNLQKYRISSEGTKTDTHIPAHGYKIVWCDKQVPISQLHASFKLANEDNAYVLLTAADESWTDTLVYCAHEGRESVGRFPDGGTKVYHMARPTIEKQNFVNMIATLWEGEAVEGNEENGMENLVAHDGDMSIRFSNYTLFLKNNTPLDVEVRVYTLGGSLAMSQKQYFSNGCGQVDVRLLSPGTYVAVLQNSEGEKCSVKFILP